MPTEEEEQRRLLTRTREQLMNKKRRVMVQIRMRLHYFGLFPENVQRRIKLQDVDEILVSLGAFKGYSLIAGAKQLAIPLIGHHFNFAALTVEKLA